jgi:acyl carrier protein
MDTLDRLRELAKKDLGLDVATIDQATPLKTLNIDSLTFVEFLFKVEEEFGISLPNEQVDGIATVGDLERCVSEAVAATGKA